jgi:hypothetical protein
MEREEVGVVAREEERSQSSINGMNGRGTIGVEGMAEEERGLSEVARVKELEDVVVEREQGSREGGRRWGKGWIETASKAARGGGGGGGGMGEREELGKGS